MTKEEKIQEAYGVHWEGFNLTAKRCALSHFGFIGNILENPPKNIELEHKMGAFRPKSLEGIENNNGWVKIQTEEDLPKDIESRKVLFRNKEGITTTYFSEDIICEIPNHFLRYSHWRIKDEILDPIF
jgi:hypothetical protein